MDYPTRLRELLKVRCVWLRTKAQFTNFPGPSDTENPYSTACWWCFRTGEALGADGSTSGPGDCDRPGRSCYEPPKRL